MNPNALREILRAAYDDGVLAPTKTKKLYLNSSVNSANKILYMVRKSGDNGLSSSQIAHRMKFNINTIRAYLSTLEALELLKRDKEFKGLTEDVFFLNPLTY